MAMAAGAVGQTPVAAAQTPVAAAQTPEASSAVAFERVAHLRRGVNLSGWYAQASDYSVARLASYDNAADFKLIRELGCDHVRLSINPEPLLVNDTPPPPLAMADLDKPISTTATLALRPEAMARLDETIRQITAAGLVVILDVHPQEAWEKTVFTDEGTPQFLYFWRGFARHFAGTDPETVYFEVLNEPHAVITPRWASEQARAIAIIRKEAPQHTIIASGVSYSNIDQLLELDPVADGNVIYTFHDYEPMTFTHQGATWAGDSLIPLRNIPYPSSPEAVRPELAALPEGVSRAEVVRYGQQHWSRQQMEARVGQAAAWGKEHNVPVWCGEFGVFRDYAPPDSRARWIADMRKTFEALNVGWDMWEYQGSFGVVSKKDGVTTVDVPIAEALGLKVPAQAAP
jgi:aryl-phospho-beta-D-glucosidase BglC (GH1 family)